MLTLLPRVHVLASLVLSAAAAGAQCSLGWQGSEPVSMPRGRVLCSALWDPDGAGPAPLTVVVGGTFTVGSTTCQVAMFDGAEWTPLGSPGTGAATAMTVRNGDLVVGVRNQVCRYAAGSWATIGSGSSPGSITAMTVFNTDLVVAGSFVAMNGAVVNGLARWNGTTWSPLGTGIDNGAVRALAVYTHQNQSALYVGGSFSTAGGIASSNLAIWTGAAWAPTAGCNAPVNTLAVRLTAAVTTSYLIVGGEFSMAGGVAADKVARFSVAANAWTSLGSMPTSDACTALLVRAGISSYEVAAVQGDRVSLWAGSGWNFLGPALDTVQVTPGAVGINVRTITYFGGRYVVGLDNQFPYFGGVHAFDGVTWQTVDGDGIPRPVLTLQPMDDDVVIGGAFRTISGVPMNGVAHGSAGAWQPLGGGVTGGNGSVNAMARLPNGDLVVGGTFTIAGGGVADRIARWNGAAWSPLGIGVGGPVHALVVMPNGDLIAGGEFATAGGGAAANIARWNGSGWSDVDGGCNGAVRALCVLDTGALIAGGAFYTVGIASLPANRVARWHGAWQPMGNGFTDTVHALSAAPGGGLFAGGAFTASGSNPVRYLARWNGANFLEIEYDDNPLTAPVRAIAILPDGSLVLGGHRSLVPLPVGGTFDNLVRIRDVYSSPWQPLQLGNSDLDVVHAIAVTAAGEVVVGGCFDRAGPLVTGNFARLATTCPASAASYGAGCAGAGGTTGLVALSLPWEGTMLRTRATGMPAQGVALVLFGFTPLAVPLAALLAEGAPGCTLLTTPDVLLLGLPNAGVLETNVFLASTPSLVGVTFFHQVVPLENFGTGTLVLTSTNGLALQGGSY